MWVNMHKTPYTTGNYKEVHIHLTTLRTLFPCLESTYLQNIFSSCSRFCLAVHPDRSRENPRAEPCQIHPIGLNSADCRAE
uniref:Uncharacterized protein n=1 Tax=Arundo donax TaxID=35708 RepID=A0A0A9DS01_ARUDO